MRCAYDRFGDMACSLAFVRLDSGGRDAVNTRTVSALCAHVWLSERTSDSFSEHCDAMFSSIWTFGHCFPQSPGRFQ